MSKRMVTAAYLLDRIFEVSSRFALANLPTGRK